MSQLDIQAVLSFRYRTSQEADRITIEMFQALGLETKAQFARLAIGRSLALGRLSSDAPDSKGIEVPAQTLFSTENIGAWVGLLVAHSKTTGSPVISDQDSLRAAVRSHWHRGALELYRDWIEADSSYEDFIETLISRRTDMPDSATDEVKSPVTPNGGGESSPTSPPQDDSKALGKALEQLNIKAQIKGLTVGPRMTRYRVLLLNLNDQSKLAKSLEKLALAMNLGNKLPAVSIGDEAMTVFVDIPRVKASWKTVPFDNLRRWATRAGVKSDGLEAYLGVSVTGSDVTFNLAAAPHLLVGGTTNSGKSVCLHSLILSLLLQHSSETLKLALIDPKRVEFARYARLKKFLYNETIATEITESKEFLTTLVAEMEARYTLFETIGVANVSEARKKGHKPPFIVVFIEELADLVLQDGSVEQLIERLAQKARAAGIHLVLATQRPDADNFSGLIRSNIPARIALTVQKGSESKIILDEVGAENLLGEGDMLVKTPGTQPLRAHGVFITEQDANQIIDTRLNG
jgi:S-DNA-T family DNA segregation ATPase FtsK/SpoIIIE